MPDIRLKKLKDVMKSEYIPYYEKGAVLETQNIWLDVFKLQNLK